jgi:hypothetical protein
MLWHTVIEGQSKKSKIQGIWTVSIMNKIVLYSAYLTFYHDDTVSPVLLITDNIVTCLIPAMP